VVRYLVLEAIMASLLLLAVVDCLVLTATAVERTASSIWRREVSSEFFEMLRTMGATSQRTASGMSRLSAIASSST
jgi:hypothetical protein